MRVASWTVVFLIGNKSLWRSRRGLPRSFPGRILEKRPDIFWMACCRGSSVRQAG